MDGTAKQRESISDQSNDVEDGDLGLTLPPGSQSPRDSLFDDEDLDGFDFGVNSDPSPPKDFDHVVTQLPGSLKRTSDEAFEDETSESIAAPKKQYLGRQSSSSVVTEEHLDMNRAPRASIPSHFLPFTAATRSASTTAQNQFALDQGDVAHYMTAEAMDCGKPEAKYTSPYGPVGYRPSAPILHGRVTKVTNEELQNRLSSSRRRVNVLTAERNKYRDALLKYTDVDPKTGKLGIHALEAELATLRRVCSTQQKRAKQQKAEIDEWIGKYARVACAHNSLLLDYRQLTEAAPSSPERVMGMAPEKWQAKFSELGQVYNDLLSSFWNAHQASNPPTTNSSSPPSSSSLSSPPPASLPTSLPVRPPTPPTSRLSTCSPSGLSVSEESPDTMFSFRASRAGPMPQMTNEQKLAALHQFLGLVQAPLAAPVAVPVAAPAGTPVGTSLAVPFAVPFAVPGLGPRPGTYPPTNMYGGMGSHQSHETSFGSPVDLSFGSSFQTSFHPSVDPFHTPAAATLPGANSPVAQVSPTAQHAVIDLTGDSDEDPVCAPSNPLSGPHGPQVSTTPKDSSLTTFHREFRKKELGWLNHYETNDYSATNELLKKLNPGQRDDGPGFGECYNIVQTSKHVRRNLGGPWAATVPKHRTDTTRFTPKGAVAKVSTAKKSATKASASRLARRAVLNLVGEDLTGDGVAEERVVGPAVAKEVVPLEEGRLEILTDDQIASLMEEELEKDGSEILTDDQIASLMEEEFEGGRSEVLTDDQIASLMEEEFENEN